MADYLNGMHQNEQGIVTAQIADGAITTEKLADDAVTTAKLGDDAADTDQIADDAVDTEQIADDAIEEEHIGNGEVKTAALGTGAVTTGKLANDAVTLGKLAGGTAGKFIGFDSSGDPTELTVVTEIADDSITNAKLADDAVDTDQIADDAVENAQIADDAVDTAQIADDAVENAQIADDAVDTAQIADDAIEEEQIGDGEVKTAAIADNAVTLAKLAGGTAGKAIGFDSSGDPAELTLSNLSLSDGDVTTAKLADDAVTLAKMASGTAGKAIGFDSSGDPAEVTILSEIADDAVTNAKIADDAVDTDQIADDAVENAQIADDAVDTAQIADDAVENAQIADDAVDTAQIADDAIENAQIADDAVDTAQIADDAIENAQIADDAVDTDQIADDAIESAQIADDAVDTAHIADDAIEEEQIGDGEVKTAAIADDAVTLAKLASDVTDDYADKDFARAQASIFVHWDGTVNPTGGVSSVTVGAGGTGYTQGASLTFSGGGGSGATGTINVSSGVITSVSITSQGIGYTSAPTVSVSGGTGASLTAVIETPDALDRAATFGTGFTDAWDSTNKRWKIMDASSTPNISNIKFTNSNIDWSHFSCHIDVQNNSVSNGNSNGALSFRFGDDASAGIGWAGNGTNGAGLWCTRVHGGTDDQKLLMMMLINDSDYETVLGSEVIAGIVRSSGADSPMTYHNGAKTTTQSLAAKTNVGFVVPATNLRNKIRLVGAGNKILIYVDGVLYVEIKFKASIPSDWGDTYSFTGDNTQQTGKISYLYELIVGSPDPADLLEGYQRELPHVSTTAGDYIIRRGSDESLDWASLSVGTDDIAADAVTLAKMASGTAGNLIGYNSDGDPTDVGGSHLTALLEALTGTSQLDSTKLKNRRRITVGSSLHSNPRTDDVFILDTKSSVVHGKFRTLSRVYESTGSSFTAGSGMFHITSGGELRIHADSTELTEMVLLMTTNDKLVVTSSDGTEHYDTFTFSVDLNASHYTSDGYFTLASTTFSRSDSYSFTDGTTYSINALAYREEYAGAVFIRDPHFWTRYYAGVPSPEAVPFGGNWESLWSDSSGYNTEDQDVDLDTGKSFSDYSALMFIAKRPISQHKYQYSTCIRSDFEAKGMSVQNDGANINIEYTDSNTFEVTEVYNSMELYEIKGHK